MAYQCAMHHKKVSHRRLYTYTHDHCDNFTDLHLGTKLCSVGLDRSKPQYTFLVGKILGAGGLALRSVEKPSTWLKSGTNIYGVDQACATKQYSICTDALHIMNIDKHDISPMIVLLDWQFDDHCPGVFEILQGQNSNYYRSVHTSSLDCKLQWD